MPTLFTYFCAKMFALMVYFPYNFQSRSSPLPGRRNPHIPKLDGLARRLIEVLALATHTAGESRRLPTSPTVARRRSAQPTVSCGRPAGSNSMHVPCRPNETALHAGTLTRWPARPLLHVPACTSPAPDGRTKLHNFPAIRPRADTFSSGSHNFPVVNQWTCI